MMAWVYLEDTGNYPTILVKSDYGNGSPTQYQIQLQGNTRKPYGYFGGNGGQGGGVNSNTALELRIWYHLASVVTYDGTNSTMRIYINGNLDTTGSQAGKTHNATGALGIGNSLIGKMDEVSLWKRALGNPFVKAVNVADLQVKQGDTTKSFSDAVAAGWLEGTLYRWKIDKDSSDAYEAITAAGDQKQLTPWDGCWLKIKVDNLTLTIPAPADLLHSTSSGQLPTTNVSSDTSTRNTQYATRR